MKINFQITIGDDVPVATRAEVRSQEQRNMIQSLAPVLLNELMQMARKLKIVNRDAESNSAEH